MCVCTYAGILFRLVLHLFLFYILIVALALRAPHVVVDLD